MKINRNISPYPSRAIKTIAIKVYRLVCKDLLTDKQILQIEWKTFRLNITSGANPKLYTPYGLNLSEGTEFEFAYLFTALLCWRAGLRKNLWNHNIEQHFSSDKFPLKPTPKLRLKKETSDIEKFRREYERSKKVLVKIDARLTVCKKDAQKVEQRRKRTVEAGMKAHRAHRRIEKEYLLASNQTAELDNKNFATRMRAKRNVKEDNSPRTR